MIGTSIREYNEEMTVGIGEVKDRRVIVAYNEAGYNSTAVDLIDVIDWVKVNMPELLEGERDD